MELCTMKFVRKWKFQTSTTTNAATNDELEKIQNRRNKREKTHRPRGLNAKKFEVRWKKHCVKVFFYIYVVWCVYAHSSRVILVVCVAVGVVVVVIVERLMCLFMWVFCYFRFIGIFLLLVLIFLFVWCCCCCVWFLHEIEKTWSPSMKCAYNDLCVCAFANAYSKWAKLMSYFFLLLHTIGPLLNADWSRAHSV